MVRSSIWRKRISQVSNEVIEPWALSVIQGYGDWMTLTHIHGLMSYRLHGKRLRQILDEFVTRGLIERRANPHPEKRAQEYRAVDGAYIPQGPNRYPDKVLNVLQQNNENDGWMLRAEIAEKLRDDIDGEMLTMILETLEEHGEIERQRIMTASQLRYGWRCAPKYGR